MAEPAVSLAFDAFDALPDPAAILAADGALLRANAVFRATFRHWIGPGRPPWGRATAPEFKEDVRRFDAPAPDGRRFDWVERLLPDGARLVIARDVSHYAAGAEAATRAKTTLFATLTHELRTPLNGIIGMTTLLDAAELEPSARNYVGAIRQSGELLLDLITEILDYSKLEAGHIALEDAPFDPESTLQDVAELLSPKARKKGIELALSLRSGVPTRVTGDDGRLRQILFNLAGNAVKFTQAGGVTLELAARPGGRLRFSIRDTGPGIAPDKQSLIFEEFAQADASIARRHGGTGLGLAIVKRLAQAMGGEVGVVSKPGHGASFWVELPLPSAADAPPRPWLDGARVCVITGSSILQQALRTTISASGGLIVEANERPDVVLWDWEGEIDAARVEALPARAVVALIPQETRAAIALCRAAGIEQYALKPARRRSLVDRINIALGRQTKESAAPERAATPPPAVLAGARVLLAEDNPVNALLAKTLLTRAGCSVVTALDGEEAIAAAAAAPYDLILLDIRMPRVDGIEAAERIRGGVGPSAIAPIVALTADAGESERARALRAGMDDFITKPIDAGRLLEVAARFMGRETALAGQ